MNVFVPVVPFLCLESHTKLFGFEHLLIFMHIVFEDESTRSPVILGTEYVFDLYAYIRRYSSWKGQ